MVAVHIYKHTLHYNYLVALETVSAFSYLGKALVTLCASVMVGHVQALVSVLLLVSKPEFTQEDRCVRRLTRCKYLTPVAYC